MLSAVSEVWSAGLSTLFEPSQDGLVERLRPQEGDRWLDIGGLGGVAIRAARSGADVTAIKADGPLVEQARRAADEAGVDVRLDLGGVTTVREDGWEVLADFIGDCKHHVTVAGLGLRR